MKTDYLNKVVNTRQFASSGRIYLVRNFNDRCGKPRRKKTYVPTMASLDRLSIVISHLSASTVVDLNRDGGDYDFYFCDGERLPEYIRRMRGWQ